MPFGGALLIHPVGTRQLPVDWQLPGLDVVPDAERIRYVKSTDEQKRIVLPAARRAVL